MDNIKYRAFDGMEIHDVQMIDFQNKEVYWLYRGHLQNKATFDEVILLKFTGFKDKQGKEIWERDLLDFEGETLDKVVWSEKYGYWAIKIGDCCEILSDYLDSYTVVGSSLLK